MSKKVIILQKVSQPGVDKMIENGWEVKFATGIDEDTIIKEAQDCDAMIVRTAPITEKILRSLPNLKVLSRYGVGVDNINIPVATEEGIWVTNVPAANTDAVAEGVIALILQTGRKFSSMERYFRAGGWDERSTNLGSEINGKSLGVIGVGRIGRKVIKKALGLEMDVYAYDPFVKKEDFPEGVTYVATKEELFKTCDFITINITYNGTQVVGKEEFKLMKPTAFFINVSRGGVCDEPELIKALQEKRIAGAGLDVFWGEPPEKDNPLLAMDNVVCLPHITGMTVESFIRSGLQNAESIEMAINGEVPACALNKPENPRNK